MIFNQNEGLLVRRWEDIEGLILLFTNYKKFMKNKHILYLLIIFLFISCKTSKDVNIPFFDKYDFNSGNYKLYGILSEGNSTSFTEKVGDFVIEDIATLNKIKNDWQIHPTDKRIACGYSYIMVLMKADSCVYHFDINLDCEYLTCEKGWFEFPAKLINKYENSVIKVQREAASAFQDTLLKRHAFD